LLLKIANLTPKPLCHPYCAQKYAILPCQAIKPLFDSVVSEEGLHRVNVFLSELRASNYPECIGVFPAKGCKLQVSLSCWMCACVCVCVWERERSKLQACSCCLWES